MERVKVASGVAAYVLGDALVTMWRDPASPGGWVHQTGEARALYERLRAPIRLVGFILRESTPPDEKLRSQMMADLRRDRELYHRIVVVPVGDSLWMSVVRSMVRGGLLLAGLNSRMSVADSAGAAFERLRIGATSQTPGQNDFAAAVDMLTQALGVSLSPVRASAGPR